MKLARSGRVLLGSAIVSVAWITTSTNLKPKTRGISEEEIAVTENTRWHNWSNNHAFKAGKTFRPTSRSQVEAIVKAHHQTGQSLRVVGSGLSPNGIAFGEDGSNAISLDLMNRSMFIDKSRMIARFESGMTVGQCVEELAAEGLMLENLASINLQTLGGFYQVGAHGTGAGIPPVDEQIIALTLVTPGKGTLEISEESNPGLFRMAKLGLGALGVVTDFTVKCVPLHNLREETKVITRKQLKQEHSQLIRENKHCKYMWVPFEDKVVVVTANETSEAVHEAKIGNEDIKVNPTISHSANSEGYDARKPFKAMDDLYRSMFPGKHLPEGINFADLRSLLLAPANLDFDHVRQVNAVETAYHMGVQGSTVKRADDTMAFDCGGQQLVLEMSMRIGNHKTDATTRDVIFVLALLERLENERLPAPIPIEHRFTSGSSAAMSQVPDKTGLFGWIGIVLYMPSNEESDRRAVKKEFARYSKIATDLARELGIEDMRIHWAKLEIPDDEEEILNVRADLERLYPVEEFRKIRSELDPKHILGGAFVKTMLD